jgi:ribosomal protein S18 acetylase RimI-like enzyme
MLKQRRIEVEMEEITIRPATLDDIDVLAYHRRAMWFAMGRDEAALAAVEPVAREYFTRALPNGGYRGFLAVTATGKVIGGGGIVISDWPGLLNQRQPKRAMILNMYVEKEYRRRGIARRLMETMITLCRENEFANVGLHASDEGRPLYEKLGFRATNEMRLDLL